MYAFMNPSNYRFKLNSLWYLEIQKSERMARKATIFLRTRTPFVVALLCT